MPYPGPGVKVGGGVAATDDHILLCERCGYPIGDLAGQAACPECGLDLGASDPARRVGSPWQARPSLSTWLDTLGLLARRPKSLYRITRVDGSRCGALLGANLAIAASLTSPAVLVPWYLGYLRRRAGTGPTDDVLTFFFAWAILWTAAFWVLWLLTRIEWKGIRFFGTRRGWRISPEVATTVVAHASYGWILAGLLGLGATLAGMALVEQGPLGLPWLGRAGLGAGGFLAGLLCFEVLVYLGVREVRFANPPDGRGVRGGGPDPDGGGPAGE